MIDFLKFYKGKRVLVTGHTGFKGTWLCKILTIAGADVAGYALLPPTTKSLFDLTKINGEIKSVIGDVRDYEKLNSVFQEFKPEIVFHLAAQPIVRESYKNPVYTYETNVMGTVNVLECIRNCESVKSFLNVTTDKVYKNNEWSWGYREVDELNGFDPYSNSKSCSELVTYSYKNSFFQDGRVAISTARAGNVIGGGDFAVDRIIPDCVRAAEKNEPIIVRNPYSTRPYQHVLEPLFAYLMIAARQCESKELAGCYNVGPDDKDCVTTGVLVQSFCDAWGGDCTWKNVSEENAPHEANFLKLDCSLIKSKFNWKPRLNVQQAIAYTVEWSKAYLSNEDINKIMETQINTYAEGK